ncbi:MAG: MBL fold metallo-hydrolase [Candidatus Dormibacteraceae bacterium]
MTWLGHGCFRLRGRGAAVVTDPYPPSLGMRLPKLEADVVTISHGHANHSNLGAVPKAGYTVSGPGEYEVAGVTVTGLPTYHDQAQGAERGRNTVYLIELDDVHVCHLGDLGHQLSEELLEQLGSVDVLLVPVGGHHTLTAAQAAEVVRQIEPRAVVPMHFSLPALKIDLEPVDRFLKEMGLGAVEAQPKLSIQASSGESETRVVLLEPRV